MTDRSPKSRLEVAAFGVELRRGRSRSRCAAAPSRRARRRCSPCARRDETCACDLRGAAQRARNVVVRAHLISCRHTTSQARRARASARSPCARRSAMPLTLSVMMRMRRTAAKGREFTAAGACARRMARDVARYTRRARIVVNDMTDFRQEFLDFALARDVLRFGEFVTKAGRKTPYFFNAGLFNDGASLRPPGRVLRGSAACVRHRVRPAVRAGVQGHHPCGGDGDRACRKRAQSAVQLQPQGSEGPRRRRHDRRRAARRARADRRRRHHRRHVGARIGRADLARAGARPPAC